MIVRTGVVESVREVSLEGTKSGVGTIGGAAIGGVAGSNVGGGDGRIVGAIVGAVLGGLAGSVIEAAAPRRTHWKSPPRRYTDCCRSGKGQDDIRRGDRVRVLTGGGKTRVSR